MAKFHFIAVPLIKIERGPYGTSRQMEIMSADQIRRDFEAKTLADVHARVDEICAEVEKGGKSWHARVVTAKGNRAPAGFNKASDAKQFDRDINPELVTVGSKAA